MAAVEVAGLNKVFRGSKESVRALGGLDLAIPGGHRARAARPHGRASRCF